MYIYRYIRVYIFFCSKCNASNNALLPLKTSIGLADKATTRAIPNSLRPAI